MLPAWAPLGVWVGNRFNKKERKRKCILWKRSFEEYVLILKQTSFFRLGNQILQHESTV